MKCLHKIAFAAVLLFILCLSGCGIDSKYTTDFFAMDTVMTITAYGRNCDAAVKAAEAEINRLDALFSVQNKNSEVFKLNSDKTLDASSDMLSLINTALDGSSLTGGAFDITTQPLTALWGFYSGLENRVPTQSEIDNALKGVGVQHISVKQSKIVLDENTSIDLGGIAKGYASSRAAKLLQDNNVTSALISLGGNVRTVGCKPDGSKWSVAIVDPDDNTKQAGVLEVSDKAVITSGGYQRCFEENGEKYHHIIDPKTGFPAKSGLKSVTVVSDDDCFADMLSTSLFIMGLEKSSQLYKENSDLFGAVFITDENKIYVTENLKDSFMSPSGFEVV